jgi:hypothetical protein
MKSKRWPINWADRQFASRKTQANHPNFSTDWRSFPLFTLALPSPRFVRKLPCRNPAERAPSLLIFLPANIAAKFSTLKSSKIWLF